MLSNYLVQNPKLPGLLDTNKAHFTDKPLVASFQALKSLVKMGCYNKNILTAGFADEGPAMLGNKAAMEFQLSGIVGAYIDSSGLAAVNSHIGFTCVSRSTAVCSEASAGAWYVPNTGDPARQQAALNFLNWALGPGYGQYLSDSGQLPVLTGFKAPAGVANVYTEAATQAQKASAQVVYEPLRATWGPFQQFMQEMVAGKISAYQVGKALQANFNQNARLQGLPGF
jgi:ABC-type glycerol-3-phosphate transport system substrate-binding protein